MGRILLLHWWADGCEHCCIVSIFIFILHKDAMQQAILHQLDAIFYILLTGEIMSTRSYKSGAQKRKEKQKAEEELIKLPKLDSFFTKADKGPDEPNASTTVSQSCESDIHPIPDTEVKEAGTSSFTESASMTEAKNIQIDTPESSMTTDNSTIRTKPNDVGLWGDLSKDDIVYWIEKGPSECQHSDGSFEKSKRSFSTQDRYCSKSLFYPKRANGEKYCREWLVYSPETGCVYCFVCKLFSNSSTPLSSDGFCDWRNPYLVQSHENSEDHRKASLAYLTRKRGSTIDCELEEQISNERQYWRHVLERVVAVIITLAERGLPFRGDEEKFGSPHNGNYLGLLELIAKFDPFLANHIEEFGNKGSGVTSYLSKTICDEFVLIMAYKVRGSILDDLNTAGYFSLSVDSTPDLSHIDQLTVIVRYISPDDGLPIERFLTFLEMGSHTGENMAKMVHDYLTKECKIDFSKCRCQSYDNAANMSGKYKGMQEIILKKNKYAVYIPCAGHSLNLVGRAAVDCCLDAVNFFGIVQEIYNFFSSSTHRWAVLLSFFKDDSKVPKSLSKTRWEAHSRATRAVLDSYDEIISALHQLHTDTTEKGETRNQAINILNKMEELEFMVMLYLWSYLLDEFHKTSQSLQDPKISLDVCRKLYASLSDFVKSSRDSFDHFEEQAKEKLPDVDYKKSRRTSRSRRIGQDEEDALGNLEPRDKFRIKAFIPVMDALESNLAHRASVYNDVAKKFSFLTTLDATEEEIFEGVNDLTQTYPLDVDMNLVGELKHFHQYVRHSLTRESLTHQDMYQIIFNDHVQSTFPNVESILRMFLSMMIANCSGERSFSQLKRIKNELRTTMTEDKLCSLSLMCIESDKLRRLSFDDVISDFAVAKSRKKAV